jgi:hypothetical protein
VSLCVLFLQASVHPPPNATLIIVDKITEEEYVRQTLRLREKRQSLQVKHAYRLRNESKRALKVINTAEQAASRQHALIGMRACGVGALLGRGCCMLHAT